MSAQSLPDLLALPKELITHILHLVYAEEEDPSKRHRSLYRLSTVCKLFESILAPTLNREIQWDLGGEQSGTIIMVDLSRLLRCPGDAELVESVSIRGCQTKQLPSNFIPHQLSEFEKGHIRRWFEELDLPDSYWEQMNMGHVDYIAALWLTRLTDIQTLDFDAISCSEDDRYENRKPCRDIAFSEVIRQGLASGSTPRYEHAVPYQSLRSVRVVADWENLPGDFTSEYSAYVYLENILPFFYLTNIQTLEFNCLVSGHTRDWPSLPPLAVNLKNLLLKRCDISEEALHLMLHVCPNLELLECEITWDADSVSTWLKAPEVGRSLHVVKKSLQHLDLKINMWTSTAIDTENQGPWGVDGSLGSLQDFVQLKSLCIPWPLLLGWHCEPSVNLVDVLPEGLEYLCLTSDMAGWWAYQWYDWLDMDSGEYLKGKALESKIEHYLQARPRELKRLSLELDVSESFESSAKKLGASLQSLGTLTDVEVEVVIKNRYA